MRGGGRKLKKGQIETGWAEGLKAKKKKIEGTEKGDRREETENGQAGKGGGIKRVTSFRAPCSHGAGGEVVGK